MSNQTALKIAMPSNFVDLPVIHGTINLNLTAIEHVMVRRIAERMANEVNYSNVKLDDASSTAKRAALPVGERVVRDRFSDVLNVSMAIAACHLNGAPLDLEQMMITWHRQAFVDDVMGIFYNLDRSTGKLMNGFRPMFAKGL